MPISSSVRVAGPFDGADATTIFPFEFKVFSEAALYVVLFNESSYDETVLVLNSDYTVDLNSDQDVSPGGEVTLGSALASGYLLTITTSLPYTQPTDLTNRGGFFPSVITDALDRLTILIQQLYGTIGRSLHLPVYATSADTEMAAPEANSLIGWNSDGTELIPYAIPDVAGVTNWDVIAEKPFVDGTVNIETDTTLTAATEVLDGGGYVIASGKTLTIRGPFRAGRAAIFSGAGTVVFERGSGEAVYPEWWGAAYGVDCTAALQSAIDAVQAGGRVSLAPYDYLTSSTITVENKNRIRLEGYGLSTGI
jgi:hypothetical protein